MSNLSQSTLMAIHSGFRRELSVIREKRKQYRVEIKRFYELSNKDTKNGRVFFHLLNVTKDKDRRRKAREKQLAKIIKELKGAMK